MINLNETFSEYLKKSGLLFMGYVTQVREFSKKFQVFSLIFGNLCGYFREKYLKIWGTFALFSCVIFFINLGN